MSSGLMVYLVGPQTRGIIGSKDKELLGDILDQMADDIEALDEQFETDDDEYGPGLTFSQAMKELVRGKLSAPEQCGFVYTYCFEMICRCFGEGLDNSAFYPCDPSWLDQLDGILAGDSASLRFKDLLDRPPPETTAFVHGDPALGHWQAEEMAAARPAVEALVAALGEQSPDSNERRALAAVSEWLEKAAAQPDAILVAFYY